MNKFEDITLTEIVEKSTLQYLKSLNGESRKYNGQFFTPTSIAKYMARMVDNFPETVKILDPGAGTGILSAALCDEIIKYQKCKYIQLDLYENDFKVIPYLEKNIAHFKKLLNIHGIDTEINLIVKDYLFYNAQYFNNTLFPINKNDQYDIIISNPPYFKLSKDCEHSRIMSSIVHGQPNIYMFFMALSSILLRYKGQLIFITPRSYCSGLYFKRFRQSFLKEIKPIHIHSFESRKETFKNEVLQETIILKGIKQKNNPIKTKITVSKNSNFDNSFVLTTGYDRIIFPKDKEKIIFIPTSKNDLEILKIVRSWNKTFSDLGFKLSTGPVVNFRATKYTKQSTDFDGLRSAPLIWMNHLKDFKVRYPLKAINKPQVITISSDSVKLLLQNKNYVLLKRFSSKEQKRRVSAYFYSSSRFNTQYIGFENHLNYVWKPLGELSEIEALGITAILNSSLIDRYFRIINGNTQVNASEINSLPFPDYNTIVNIGLKMTNEKSITYSMIDSILAEEMLLSSVIKEKMVYE
ncbi:Eco57I restriction-modification methylase domain-containing protein [bacterium]|nr:Eco57I restriction-modification methylase domain-containing protein [bacterium]